MAPSVVQWKKLKDVANDPSASYSDIYTFLTKLKYKRKWKYDQSSLDKLMTRAILDQRPKLIRLILAFENDPLVIEHRLSKGGDSSDLVEELLESRRDPQIEEDFLVYAQDLFKTKSYSEVIGVCNRLMWGRQDRDDFIRSGRMVFKPLSQRTTRYAFLQWLKDQPIVIPQKVFIFSVDIGFLPLLLDYTPYGLPLTASMFIPFRRLYREHPEWQEKLSSLANSLQDLYVQSLEHSKSVPREFCSSLQDADIHEIQVPLVLNEQTVYLPFIHYTSDEFNSSVFDLQDFSKHKPYTQDVATIESMSRTNYKSGVDDLLAKDFSFQIDPRWLYQSNKYIANLDLFSFFTLIGYSQGGYQLPNQYLYANTEEKKQQIIDELFDKYKDHTEYSSWYFDFFVQLLYLVRHHQPKEYLVNPEDSRLFATILKEPRSMQYKLFIRYLPRINSFGKKVILTRFISDLQKIIDHAPSIPSECVVYRGLRDYSYKKPRSQRVAFPTFISTSVTLSTAREFLGDSSCCIVKLLLQPGVKALFLRGLSTFAHENEVLLSNSNEYEHVVQKTIRYRPHQFSTPKDDLSNVESVLCDTSPMSSLKMDTIKVFPKDTT